MNEAPLLRMGIYRHYKGPLYQVLGLAHDANYEGRTAVIYFALELNGAHLGPRLAVRTLDDFTAHVFPDGTDWSPDEVRRRSEARNGALPGREDLAIARFTYLGSELTKEMLDG